MAEKAIVLATFQDTDGVEYEKGSDYPQSKLERLSKERREVLMTAKNAYNQPFLEIKAEKEKKSFKKAGE